MTYKGGTQIFKKILVVNSKFWVPEEWYAVKVPLPVPTNIRHHHTIFSQLGNLGSRNCATLIYNTNILNFIPH